MLRGYRTFEEAPRCENPATPPTPTSPPPSPPNPIPYFGAAPSCARALIAALKDTRSGWDSLESARGEATQSCDFYGFGGEAKGTPTHFGGPRKKARLEKNGEGELVRTKGSLVKFAVWA